MSQHQEIPSASDNTNVKTILVVEDDEAIGEFLERVISEETPYKVLLVKDGFEALKVTRDIKPDLLLLDYQLPYMNGIELYDQLHAIKEFEETPGIMMSAHLPTHELKKRSLTGLSKPLEVRDLLDALAQ